VCFVVIWTLSSDVLFIFFPLFCEPFVCWRMKYFLFRDFFLVNLWIANFTVLNKKKSYRNLVQINIINVITIKINVITTKINVITILINVITIIVNFNSLNKFILVFKQKKIQFNQKTLFLKNIGYHDFCYNLFLLSLVLVQFFV
jgi:hypothetical protein